MPKTERHGVGHIHKVPIRFHLRDVMDRAVSSVDDDHLGHLTCMFDEEGLRKVLALTDCYKEQATDKGLNERELAMLVYLALCSDSDKFTIDDIPDDAFRCNEVEITTTYYDRE